MACESNRLADFLSHTLSDASKNHAGQLREDASQVHQEESQNMDVVLQLQSIALILHILHILEVLR